MDLLARPDPTGPNTPAARSGDTAADPDGDPVPGAGAGPRRRRRLLTALGLLLAAVIAGLVLVVAFPPYDLWWAAPFGVALLALATYGRGFWVGAGLGFVMGLSFLIPLLAWAGGYVGSVWLFLPFGESVYFALLGGLSALTTTLATRAGWRWAWPVATATLWVLQEALRDRTPFGGFPWARLAFSQGDSPLLRLAAVGGAPLVTAATALVGGLLALAVRTVVGAETTGGRAAASRALRPAIVAVVPGIIVSVAPAPLLWGGTAPAAGEQTVRVAVVQGNVPRLGLEFNEQRRAVLDNHVNATLALAARVAAGQTPRPDLVIWPENSSDIDPIVNSDAADRITRAATAVGAPILVGSLSDGPGENQVRNVGLVWDPVAGPTLTYVKRHPVPFAEYVPMRAFVRQYITTKVDLVRKDFVPGATPGVLTFGGVTVGDVICFEVADDGIVRDTVTGGAQILAVQTNNATFNEAEARQQLAMVRLRAVEHGREALMASTVGVSAFVDAHGTVYDATRFDTPAVIERDMTMSNGRTMATRLGVAPELVLAAGGVGLVLAALVLRRRRRGQNDNAARGTR